MSSIRRPEHRAPPDIVLLLLLFKLLTHLLIEIKIIIYF